MQSPMSSIPLQLAIMVVPRPEDDFASVPRSHEASTQLALTIALVAALIVSAIVLFDSKPAAPKNSRHWFRTGR